MKNGIYFVTFRSNLLEYGESIVVIRNGVVNGGNYICTYHGKVVANTIELLVVKHDRSKLDAFGSLDKYRLLLVIKEDGDGYFLLGEMLEDPINKVEVNLKFIGQLLD